jgi:hypothetical protein
MNVEMASQIDEILLDEILNDEKYEWIRSYDIHVKMFYKYGKYDKDGNLKTPALVKNGQPIPASIKIVSAFNRLTDNVDVKIIINKDIWDEYSKDRRKATLDGILNYLELKTDKIGEPISISDDSDKVQLKLKKPDFYCEGFISLVEKYGLNYDPIQDAKSIIGLLNNSTVDKSKSKNNMKLNDSLNKEQTIKSNDPIEEYDDSEVNLDEINLD